MYKTGFKFDHLDDVEALLSQSTHHQTMGSFMNFVYPLPSQENDYNEKYALCFVLILFYLAASSARLAVCPPARFGPTDRFR